MEERSSLQKINRFLVAAILGLMTTISLGGSLLVSCEQARSEISTEISGKRID